MRAALILALVVTFTPAARAGAETDDPDAAALAETERAFARLGVENGVRASFLVYFADDAIVFEPGPLKAKAAMLARPAPATKPAYTLDWWPEVVKVSRSGDFGWSTGPSHLTPDPGTAKAPPPNDGHYFSIWKKRGDGTWKVSLDIGVSCPLGSIAPRGNTRLVRTGNPKQTWPAAGAAAELQGAITRAVAQGEAASVLGRFAPDARLYVDGEPLVTGAEPARVALRKLPAASLYEPAGADVAMSGDLALTYGRLDFTDTAGKRQSRWVVNVWQRDEPTGPWQVTGAAYDTPIPSPQK
jgi:ketosteroid isomerase-like protein